ncbi:NUDIX domain-containing protein [Streptomyces sp. NBC_01221]|uniref:NUDIX domain-containing protein n=1 Tax=unclassified Streptomyces TaxID=2593676 RepID=UPI00224FD23E|nr:MULTISPECIES: NUDIX domain-containing protein [unclassified Streptomyces]MCX4789227.1 NUDIX domain-containing protein [Streptomyces sp. NBC_01221]WSJ36336.1 NUDIX domain-containing protein [Streptomyces sp. NBC_01321]WSU21879.1 NUDIX domain-containing protein [Streptomyces sp. NBC_01108]
MGRIDYLHDPAAPPANSVVPSIVAFVQNDSDDVLLIQRSDNGRWALPGGGHDLGESISDTVVREVWEETGIKAEVTDMSGIYTDPGHVMLYDDGEARQQFSICFRARPVSGGIRTSDETTQVRWVSPADLIDYDIHPTMRLRIEHAMDRGRTAPYIG